MRLFQDDRGKIFKWMKIERIILLVFVTLYAIILNKDVAKEKWIIIITYIINVFRDKRFVGETWEEDKIQIFSNSYTFDRNAFQSIMHKRESEK